MQFTVNDQISFVAFQNALTFRMCVHEKNQNAEGRYTNNVSTASTLGHRLGQRQKDLGGKFY